MTTKIIENKEKTALVSFSGELDTTAVNDVRTTLEPLMKDPGKEITLDFSQLEYISSAGMRVLLALNKNATATNGKVIIKGMREDIKQLFQLTGFDSIFEMTE
ncbi:MAG: STAS domain-containing protein [Bacteroidaceae bacterium]|nr:STAS domain-containing protein [Bacteroidaceae bacterium]